MKISDALTSLVADLTGAPAFVLAKGGITSSDVGVKALRVHCARVRGQIAPGVPVWETGEESTFPHTPYIIFPGNVGTEGTSVPGGTDIAQRVMCRPQYTKTKQSKRKNGCLQKGIRSFAAAGPGG
ncbi:MAG: nucleotide-binding domain containing protein [Dysosmobacter sp.]